MNAPRIVRGMSDADYHADPDTLSSTGARRCAVSPAAYKWALDHPTPPTEAMLLGTAAHSIILNTGAVAVVGNDLRTADAKAAKADAETAGTPWVRERDHEALLTMREHVMTHPDAGALLTGGESEVSVYTTHPTGAALRTRPDRIRDRRTVVDLKTARDANPQSWGRVMADAGYHVQAAWYLRELVAADLVDEDAQFWFVVVASSPPHQVAVHRVGEEALAVGEWEADRGIRQWVACRESGEWPDWADDYPQEAVLPTWATRPYYTQLADSTEGDDW